MMIENKVDEIVILTKDALAKLLVKRDFLLNQLMETDLHKYSKEQFSYKQNSSCEKALLSEKLDKIIKWLMGFDIDSYFNYLYEFEDKYNQIYSKNVHLKVMKREMTEYLYNALDCFKKQEKQLDERYYESIDLQESLSEILNDKHEYICVWKELVVVLSVCKHQYSEINICLKRLIEFFSIPTETPPQL